VSMSFIRRNRDEDLASHRNDADSKCGASPVSGCDNANARIASTVTCITLEGSVDVASVE
jgi:hypothetical protein